MASKAQAIPTARPAWGGLALTLAILAGLAAPFLLGGFATYQLTYALIYAIAILGLNLLTGFNGQFSFGHSAFYALGGYTAAMLMDRLGVPAYLTLPAAGLTCLAFGCLFGIPASRLSYIYLALATYALAVATPQLLKSALFERWTGGVQGLYLDRPPVPAGVPLIGDQWWYLVSLATLLAVFWLAHNLGRGRIGRAMIAVRDQPIAAAAIGINVTLIKALTFGVSACCAGIAGALATLLAEYIAPDTFTVSFSILLLVGAVAGGIHSIYGAVLGGLFITYVPLFANMISKDLTWPVFGALLISAVWIMPTGVAGLVERQVERYRKARGRTG